MNKNERPAFLKGKGAAVGAVLCFVAVITMVGATHTIITKKTWSSR